MEDKLKYLIDQFNNTLKVKSEEFVLLQNSLGNAN